jgi:hypothetical protein
MRRPTRLKLALLTVLASATVVLVGAPAGDAAISSDSGVHTWLFDGANTAVDTSAEAVTVAKRNDLIVGVPRYGQYLAAMKSAHPGIVIAQYHKGTTVKEDYPWVAANHPDWLLRGSNGNVLKSSWGGYLINPQLAGVRQWEASYAQAQQAAGWTGVYMDSMGSMAFYGFPSTPINPQTHKPFTMTEWLNATTGLASAVDAAVTIPVIDNGLNNGTRYFANMSPLGAVGQGGVFEECFRDATDGVAAWPSATDWLNQVKAIIDVQSRGKIALCLTKLWVSATDAQRTQWQRFALSSFLLAKGSSADFMFMGSKTQNALSTANTGFPALGTATGAMKQSGSLYMRYFQHGVVVVNPSGSAASTSLGASYTDTTGRAVTSATLGGHTGAIFTK